VSLYSASSVIPLMRCVYLYSENNRVVSRRLKLSVLSVGSRRSSLSEFQSVGLATANDRRPYELRLCQGSTTLLLMAKMTLETVEDCLSTCCAQWWV